MSLRILMVVEELPYPADQGDRIRCLHLIRGLGHHHEVTVLCFCPSDGSAPEVVARTLQLGCEAVVTVPRVPPLQTAARLLFSPLEPVTVSKRWAPALKNRAGQLVTSKEFDVAFAYQLKMAPYVIDLPVPVRAADLTDCLTLYLERAALHEPRPLKRALLVLEKLRVARSERRCVRQLDLVTMTAAGDAEKVGEFGPGARLLQVPNGVPDSWLEPDQIHARQNDSPSLLFVGNMAYPPNEEAVLWIARDVLPLIRVEAPRARLVVVGKNPSPRVQSLHAPGKVEIVGRVNDVRPWLLTSDVLLAPLRYGTGTSLKVLEAMAVGLPVVTNSAGARGLGLKAGVQAEVVDGARQTAERTCLLLRDPCRRARISARARSFVKRRYLWSSIVRRLSAQLEAQVASSSRQYRRMDRTASLKG